MSLIIPLMLLTTGDIIGKFLSKTIPAALSYLNIFATFLLGAAYTQQVKGMWG
jgi:hypothetical protein